MKTLYIDMDNVLVDFPSGIEEISAEQKIEYEGRPDEVPGIFELIDPMPDAFESIHKLSKAYVYVLSTAPWLNPSAWINKIEWNHRYLGKDKDSVLYKRLILSHHKNLKRGSLQVEWK